MGGGVARWVRELFPEAYEADLKTGYGDEKKLGTFSFAKVIPRPSDTRINPNIKFIVNLYGQFNLGLQERMTNYEAIARGLEALGAKMCASGDPSKKTVALPYRMGSNLGGGDWKVVRAIIESVFANSPITAYICNNEEELALRNKKSK
jgi:O-acetyl-ADP-ribose deacetylase (regulator of RNase III)